MMLLLVLLPNKSHPELLCIVCGLAACDLCFTTDEAGKVTLHGVHERCAEHQNARSSRT